MPAGAEAPLDPGQPVFEDPFHGALTFLRAVESKDTAQIAEAIAIRSEYEATPEHRKVFKSLLTCSADQEILDQLTEIFKGMKIVGSNGSRARGCGA